MNQNDVTTVLTGHDLGVSVRLGALDWSIRYLI